jgi:hypothetical protein
MAASAPMEIHPPYQFNFHVRLSLLDLRLKNDCGYSENLTTHTPILPRLGPLISHLKKNTELKAKALTICPIKKLELTSIVHHGQLLDLLSHLKRLLWLNMSLSFAIPKRKPHRLMNQLSRTVPFQSWFLLLAWEPKSQLQHPQPATLRRVLRRLCLYLMQ